MKPLSSTEHQRVGELRARAQLRPDEAAELAQLLARADVREVALLAPRNQVMASENQTGEAENQQLAALVERKQALAKHLALELQNARAERRAIDLELQRILQMPPSESSASPVLAGAKP